MSANEVNESIFYGTKDEYANVLPCYYLPCIRHEDQGFKQGKTCEP